MAKILLIENEDVVRRNLASLLEQENHDVYTAQSKVEGLIVAAKTKPDIILYDVNNPKMDGYHIFDELQRQHHTRGISFILIVEENYDTSRRPDIYLGPHHALSKPFSHAELVKVIRSQVLQRLATQARYGDHRRKLDTAGVTRKYNQGIGNLLYLKEQFSFALPRFNAQQAKDPGTKFQLPLYLISVENYQAVRGSLDPLQQPRLPLAIAQRLGQNLGNDYRVARIRKDKFAILGPPAPENPELINFVDSIIDFVARPFSLAKTEISLDIRIGVSLYPACGKNFDHFLKSAVKALRKATTDQAKKYCLQKLEDQTCIQRHGLLKKELAIALQQNQLAVFYQPQINLKTGEVSGLEALLRWKHPELGVVHPAEFIPVAQEIDCMSSLGLWGLRTAVYQVRHWQKNHQENLRLAINLSSSELNNPMICQDIIQILAEADFDPECLDIEISELTGVQEFQKIRDQLKMIQEVGVKIAIDDFGTGSSSLQYVHLFPWDSLKIDPYFIENLHTNETNAAITKGLIEMSHGLGIRVIAEGVENSSELAVLSEYGCDEVQGYFLGYPVSAKVLEKNIFHAFKRVDR